MGGPYEGKGKSDVFLFNYKSNSLEKVAFKQEHMKTENDDYDRFSSL